MSLDKEKAEKVRNIGIVAHIDAGKTTTTEKFLFQTGRIWKSGTTHEGDTQMDYLEAERKRGITITSAATTISWNNHQINLIDTPGHIDFTAEVERSLRVLDGAVLIIDSQAGVEPQTETVWRQTERYENPRLIFFNKMDKIGADFYYSLKTIEEKLGANTLILQIPIGSENNLEGIVDIVTEKAYSFDRDLKEEYKEIDVPFNLISEVSKFKVELLDKITLFDDDLLTKYMNGENLTTLEIKYLIRKATLSTKVFPIFCGTAFKNIGIKFLLDGIIDYLPSPLDLKNKFSYMTNKESKDLILNSNDCAALAFKVVNNSLGKGVKTSGKLTFIRVYSGKILPNTYYYNSTLKKEFKIGRLLRMHADSSSEIKEVCAGDVAAAVGLKDVRTGDTICNKDKQIVLENISFTEPVISIAINPETKQDGDKLKDVLEKIVEEDQTLKYKFDNETGQLVISGMGELHLEIVVDRMKSQYGISVKTGKPQVAYRETIKKTVEKEGIYKKQTGGHGSYGHVRIKFEPNPDKGFEFVNKIEGGRIPSQYIPYVEKGLKETLSAGLLLGYPVVDIKCTLNFGSYHDVDSSDADYKIAAAICLREAIPYLNLTLLEPIMKVEAVIPNESDYCGKTIGILNSRRGSIENIDLSGNLQKVHSLCPLSEMSGFLTEIRSATAGRGTYSMELNSYREVPKDVCEEIIKKKKNY